MERSQKSVLIVDDVKDMRELLAAHIEKLDLEAVQADSEKSMLKYLASDQQKPDLILLDINLPDGSGLESAAKIRSVAGSSTPKLCFISGERDKKVVLAALRAGAADYIVKPIDPVLFKKKMANLLGLSVDGSPALRRKVDLPVTFPDIPMKSDSKMVELSEEGCLIQSNLQFDQGSHLQVQVPELNLKFGSDQMLQCLIKSAVKTTNGFAFECVFVGLHESVREKIRKMVIALPDAPAGQKS